MSIVDSIDIADMNQSTEIASIKRQYKAVWSKSTDSSKSSSKSSTAKNTDTYTGTYTSILREVESRAAVLVHELGAIASLDTVDTQALELEIKSIVIDAICMFK